jgi:signal transduction histidine kinase
LAVLAGSVATLVCLVVSALTVVGIHGRVADYRQEKVANAALNVVALVKRNRLPRTLTREKGVSLQVVNARGRVVASTPDLSGKEAISRLHPPANSTFAHQVLCPPPGLEGCRIVVSFRIFQGEGDWYVYAAGGATPWYTSRTLVVFLVGVSLLLVLLTVLGAYRTVGKTLAPVEAIRAELAEISGSDLGRRVPVPETRDEVRSLAETANATLDRLEAAVDQLRRFTSDASHDLRSPITAMRAQVEEALLHPQDADWPRAGRAILDSLDRLQAIVTDLLTLSKLDAEAPQKADSIDLGRVVSAELERRPRSKEVVSRLEPGVLVCGDALRLGRLLTNLVDNAERHAVAQITVTVRTDEEGDAVLEVLDDGAGIDPEQWEVVFRRFTRLDAARSRDSGGTGLGLSIARHIAEAHGGSLRIEPSDRGARFVLRLPRT